MKVHWHHVKKQSIAATHCLAVTFWGTLPREKSPAKGFPVFILCGRGTDNLCSDGDRLEYGLNGANSLLTLARSSLLTLRSLFYRLY